MLVRDKNNKVYKLKNGRMFSTSRRTDSRVILNQIGELKRMAAL